MLLRVLHTFRTLSKDQLTALRAIGDIMDNSKSSLAQGLPRRRILGWLGLGAVSAMFFRILPMKKMVSGRVFKKGDEKISISINERAVKRSGRVTRNV